MVTLPKLKHYLSRENKVKIENELFRYLHYNSWVEHTAKFLFICMPFICKYNKLWNSHIKFARDICKTKFEIFLKWHAAMNHNVGSDLLPTLTVWFPLRGDMIRMTVTEVVRSEIQHTSALISSTIISLMQSFSCIRFVLHIIHNGLIVWSAWRLNHSANHMLSFTHQHNWCIGQP